MTTTLLAFLGTTSYVPVRYELGAKITAQAHKYVATALLELLDRRPDRVVVAATAAAYKANGEALQNACEAMLGRTPEFVDIPEGVSEKELWKIFSKVGDSLEGGSLVFDATHGFRSLSLVGLLALGFYRHTKKLTDIRLLYGAFDAIFTRYRETSSGPVGASEARFRAALVQREIGGVRDIPKLTALSEETGFTPVAPIFDLTTMLELPGWAEAVAEWERTGRAVALVERVEAYRGALGREMRGGPPSWIWQLERAIGNFDTAAAMLRPAKVIEDANKVREAVDAARSEIDRALEAAGSFTPMKSALEILEEHVRPLVGSAEHAADELERWIEVANWYAKRDRFAEAFTVLQETGISAAVAAARLAGVLRSDGPLHGESSQTRSSYSAIMNGLARGESRVNQTVASSDERVLDGWLEANGAKDLFNAMEAVREERNKINHAWASHAGEKFNKDSAATVSRKLQQALNVARRLAGKIRNAKPLSAPERPKGVFLNLSHHPCSEWTEEQREAALALDESLCELVDLEFPNVPPEATDVAPIAKGVLAKVPENVTHAMVQGEHVLTMQLVSELKQRGIRCYAASTERLVESLEPGVRRSRFRFAGFREYGFGEA